MDVLTATSHSMHVQKVKRNQAKLFVHTFAYFPVLASILKFSILTVFRPEVALQMY